LEFVFECFAIVVEEVLEETRKRMEPNQLFVGELVGVLMVESMEFLESYFQLTTVLSSWPSQLRHWEIIE